MNKLSKRESQNLDKQITEFEQFVFPKLDHKNDDLGNTIDSGILLKKEIINFCMQDGNGDSRELKNALFERYNLEN